MVKYWHPDIKQRKERDLQTGYLGNPGVFAASYKKAIVQPWIGATKDELTAKWGYPQTSHDLVKIDDDTVVFSYRSVIRNAACIVSFTLKNDVVIAWKYRGGNCPRIKRDKKVGLFAGSGETAPQAAPRATIGTGLGRVGPGASTDIPSTPQ